MGKGVLLNLKKFLHTNKGFFILSLIAAILGTIASVFFGGCSKVEEQSDVIVSKRVKIDVQEVIPDEVVVPANKGEVSSAAKDKKVRKVAPREAKTSKKRASRTKTAKSTPSREKRHTQKQTSTRPITKTWAVNVASFTRSADARRLKSKLISSGRHAYITEFTKDGTLYYRVRVGFYATRARAKQEGRAISSSFRNTGDAWVTRPGKAEIRSHTR